MSVHLNNTNAKVTRSPCTFVQIPVPSSSTTSPPLSSSLPPLLDAALMTVVQQRQSSRTPPPGFDRNQYEQILINYTGVRSSTSPSPSPKLPKSGTSASMPSTTTSSLPPALPAPPPPPPPPSSSSTTAAAAATATSANCPPPNQHHVPLLTAHSFLYNPVEPCIFPIAIPPGFPSATPEFMRLFAPNMAAVAAAAAVNTNNPSAAGFVANNPQGSLSNSRSNTQSNGTNTPPEPNVPTYHHHHHHPPSSSASSTVSRHQQSHYRHRQHYTSDTHQYQQNPSHSHQQRQSQSSYSHHQQQSRQQHNLQKACYTCGDIGHLAFACPEQYLSDSNYSHNTRGIEHSNKKLIRKQKTLFFLCYIC